MVAIVVVVAGIAAYVVSRFVGSSGNTQNDQNQNDAHKCDSIKSLLDQKKQELEDFVRSWPQEKAKDAAKEKILAALARNETLGKAIEVGEDVKEKYDKLQETIDKLKAKYDLCMISVGAITGRKTHVVIFSHGFGVRKDDRGLFTDIAAGLPNVTPIMFDYNEVDETGNVLTVRTFSQQAALFKEQVERAKRAYPGATIDLVCHSQGAVAPAIACVDDIRKSIFLAAPLDRDNQRMFALFNARPGSVIDQHGISKLARKDGSMTIVPPEYWKERENFDPIGSYNRLAEKTEFVLIEAAEDDILHKHPTNTLSAKITVMALPGDHSFQGTARKQLVETISKLLSEAA